MTDESKKRGKRKLQECPYCHKHFGNVKNHILMAHPTEAEKQPAVQLTKEDLLNQAKTVESKPEDELPVGERALYHCNNCGASLRKGENPCHNCNERLIWDGIQ
jgi:hypothetical protein